MTDYSDKGLEQRYAVAKMPYDLQAMAQNGGAASAAPTKHDQGKLRYDLLPVDALAEVVKSMTLGATKYGDHNYLKGFEWHRPYAAAQRHMNAFWSGENIDLDDKTGVEQHHLAAAIVNLMFLLVHDLRNLGTDDRINLKSKA